MRRAPVIGLLTDFGTRDWYAAAMKAVILSRSPGVQLVDITHEIPAQDVVKGAFTLAAAVPWFPRGSVLVAVVDPGVGSDRAMLAAAVDGRFLLGPDNGLLWPSLAQGDTPARIVRLTRPRYWLPRISRTFHGRDILAPVAAHLARGTALSQLGVPVRRPVTLRLPRVYRQGGAVHACVIDVDRFGNLMTNLPGSLLERAAVRVRCRNRSARVVDSYDEGRPSELLALVGSLGLVELAVRNGSAARRFPSPLGARVVLRTTRR